ncbi:MAG: DUF4340 domain-containing protein [Candidatus Promineifilaceae bacterium]
MPPMPSLSLKVEDHLWRVGHPVDDVADPDRVNALLASMQDTEWLDQLRREDLTTQAWQLSGLDKPFAHVVLRSAGVIAVECWVGNASALDGACYLSVPGKKQDERVAHVVRTELLNLLKKPVDSWRDDHLFRVPAESVSRIALSTTKGTIEVARNKPKAPWDLIKPLQTRGQNERINELLAALLGLKITAVAPTDALKTSAPADALKILVTTPAFSKPVEITLVTPPDIKSGQTQATIHYREHSYTVTSDHLAALWVQLNDLRDDHLARVDAEKVDAVLVSSAAAGEIALRKENDRWLLQRNEAWEPASGERVAKLFEALNEHRVKEFVADSASNLMPYGLDKPFMTLSWNEAGDKPAVDPAPIRTSGKSFSVSPIIHTDTTLLFGQDSQGNVYAKYDIEPFVYRVGASVLSAVPRDNVRWKATTPVRFSQFALRQISISVGTNPPVILDYNPISAEWKGSRAGSDISAAIDRVKADQLANKLGNLVVEDWAQDRTDGTKALQVPAITVQVTLLTEAGNVSSASKTIAINFAPTVAGTDTALYYGRVDHGPDIFLLTRSDLRDLLKSVMKDAN